MAEAIIDGAGSGYRLRITPEGAIPISGAISVSAGSESFIYGKSGADWIGVRLLSDGTLAISGLTTGGGGAGSVTLYDTSGVSLFFDGGNVPVSGVYFPGSVYQATNPWVISGNVLASGTVSINNPATIGSYTNQFVLGSTAQLTDPWRVTGSISRFGVGSIYGIGIGSIFSLVAGSVEIKTNLATIGSYSVQQVAGSINISGIPSVTVTNRNVGIYENSDAIYWSGTYAPVSGNSFTNATSGTSLQLIAASAGSKILVLAYNMWARSGVDVVFKDWSTEITGWNYFAANTGIVNGYNPKGWALTAAGGSVCLVANGTGSVSGRIIWTKVV